MERIAHPTASGGLFTEGDPGTSTPATVVTAAWLNGVQEELANAIEAAGITLDGENDAQLASAIGLLASAKGGFKNAVVNGDMQVWQRGDTFTGIGTLERYTADRWAVVADGTGGAGVATVSKQGFAVGNADVPGARNFLRYAQTTPSTAGGGRIRTKLEALEQMAGGQVAVSLYLKAVSAATVTAKLHHVFGAGSSAEVASQALAVTTSWQLFTFTATLPSVAGQTITQATAHLLLELVLPTGSPTLDVARVQLEKAAIAGSFEVRPLALELLLCQRYYEKSYELDTVPGTVTLLGARHDLDAGGGPIQGLAQRFVVPKRAIPTIGWWSPTTGTLNRVHRITEADDLTPIQTLATSRVATGHPEVANTWDTRVITAHWTAEAEL